MISIPRYTVAGVLLVLTGCTQPGPSPRSEASPRAADLLKTPSPVFEEEARAAPAKGPATVSLSRTEALGALRAAVLPGSSGENPGEGGTGLAPSPATARGEAAPARKPSPEPHPGSETRRVDPLEDHFLSLREQFRSALTREPGDRLAALERAELESKLIAFFFLRDRSGLEAFRDLIRSFPEGGAASVELDLLRAALYQRVGQADLRDLALDRASRALSSSATTRLEVTGLDFAREIRGYRTFVPRGGAEFQPGEEVLLYGELEGFQNASASRPDGSPAHRRSFSAELVLRGPGGQEIDRRPILRAGQAVELAADPSKPVHFWARYTLPAKLIPGRYRLEVEAADLEGKSEARGALPLTCR